MGALRLVCRRLPTAVVPEKDAIGNAGNQAFGDACHCSPPPTPPPSPICPYPYVQAMLSAVVLCRASHLRHPRGVSDFVLLKSLVLQSDPRVKLRAILYKRFAAQSTMLFFRNGTSATRSIMNRLFVVVLCRFSTLVRVGPARDATNRYLWRRGHL